MCVKRMAIECPREERGEQLPGDPRTKGMDDENQPNGGTNIYSVQRFIFMIKNSHSYFQIWEVKKQLPMPMPQASFEECQSDSC